jgi:hypothetical protein
MPQHDNQPDLADQNADHRRTVDPGLKAHELSHAG